MKMHLQKLYLVNDLKRCAQGFTKSEIQSFG